MSKKNVVMNIVEIVMLAAFVSAFFAGVDIRGLIYTFGTTALVILLDIKLGVTR